MPSIAYELKPGVLVEEIEPEEIEVGDVIQVVFPKPDGRQNVGYWDQVDGKRIQAGEVFLFMASGRVSHASAVNNSPDNPNFHRRIVSGVELLREA